MQDKPVALVTGANKGIGLETVRRLIGAGHRVYLASRDIERGRAAGEEMQRLLSELHGIAEVTHLATERFE